MVLKIPLGLFITQTETETSQLTQTDIYCFITQIPRSGVWVGRGIPYHVTYPMTYLMLPMPLEDGQMPVKLKHCLPQTSFVDGNKEKISIYWVFTSHTKNKFCRSHMRVNHDLRLHHSTGRYPTLVRLHVVVTRSCINFSF